MIDDVALWLECLERKEDPRRFFARFMNEVVAEHPKLRGSEPRDLLEFQANAQTRQDRFLIADAVRHWINNMTLTAGTKKTRWSQVNSFFLHRNKESLPSDPSWHWTNTVTPVDGYLPMNELQAIIMGSNLMYRSVFLMKYQGLLDNQAVIYINEHYARQVMDAFEKDVGVFRLALPPRKMNPQPYFTMLSTRSDFGDAFRAYRKHTTNKIDDRLFWTNARNPLQSHNIQYYFHQRAVKLGIIRPCTPECVECGGDTVWRRRLYGEGKERKKMVCYVCVKCGSEQFACDLGPEWRHRLSRVRYGKHPHEMRDLASSRWGDSGADRVVREFMMGHTIDPNKYEQMKYRGFVEREYVKALPWLNILSADPEKISRRQVDADLEAQNAKVDALSHELVEVKRDLNDLAELLRDPEKMEKFRRLLTE